MKKKNPQAYLSIFMSLTLTLVLSLCLVLIEGTRQNTVRLEAECIVDIGMNSVLAEYHREILKQYNLFYIDSSYGTEYPSYYNTEARLRKYMERNASLKDELGLLEGNNIFPGVYMDLLKLEFPEVKICGVSLATDNKGYHFQQQAIQAVQSDMGIDLVEEVASWIKVVEENNLLVNELDAQMEALEKELEGLRGKKQLDDSSFVFVEVENPMSHIIETRSKGILRWVVDDMEEISTKVISSKQYISDRYEAGNISTGNIVSEGTLSFYERLLFQEYLFRYGGSYRDIKENAQLDYQIEYLLFGSGSDMENLRKTAAAICGMREVANMLYLAGAREKRELVTAASTVLAAALFVPEAEPLFEAMILIGWSFLESMQDTKILMAGGRVPLLKDDSTWNCSLENAFDLHTDNQGNGNGVAYEDYLRLFMYFADLETITYRFMDLMEMDIRKVKGNEAFRMDGCIDYLEVQVAAKSHYGYQYCLKHAKGYR